MRSRHRKLKEWVAAGLLSESQAEAIHAHEERHRGGSFGRGLIGLSLFAILVGILSIIAANWSDIPAMIKITVHVALNIAAGVLAIRADKQGRDLWREGATLVFLGLTFTLIILIGQIYQLSGSLADALLFWFVITLPFFLLMGRTHMTAALWIAAFLATVAALAEDKLDMLPDAERDYVMLGLAAFLPLALMADGKIAFFQRLRPALAEVSLKVGMALSVLFASSSLSLWSGSSYNDDNDIVSVALILFMTGTVAIAVHAWRYDFYKRDAELKSGALFALAGLAALLLPFMAPDGVPETVAAIVFIAYWVLIGWLAQRLHKMPLVSLAIVVIAVRIFWIYVDLFGSLMDTGFGLITGGIVMLLLIEGARRLNRRIVKGGTA